MSTSRSEKEALSCLYWIQEHVFHDQTHQPASTHPLFVFAVRRAWCGGAARTLMFLLGRRGIKNRSVALRNHVAIEAFWHGGWHVLDGDLFKHHIVLRQDDGSIPSVADLQGSCLVDRFPPTMYLYTREYKRYRTLPLERLQVPRMFEPHEAGYMSYYYQIGDDIPLEYPPSRPTGLHASQENGCVNLSWTQSQDKDADLMGYEVMLAKKSRGWSYLNPDLNRGCVPKDTSEPIIFTEEPSVQVKLSSGRWFWSVRAVDEHRKREPHTYYFPSEESSFLAS